MVGRYQFKVRSYECGPDGRATLPTVCNFLQEAASLHAASLGFGKSDFAAAGENISWVLTRLVVKMIRYPVWEDEVTVETFPRGGRKIVAWRDFEVKDAQGETLGVASSEWMVIDLATRKIHAVPETVFAANDPANVPVLGLEPFAKFRFPDGGSDVSPLHFTAMKSQIDLNGHVNNVHYVGWMLEQCENRCPAETEVVFRSETFAGDEVRVETAVADGYAYHRVSSSDGKDHIVARTRPDPDGSLRSVVHAPPQGGASADSLRLVIGRATEMMAAAYAPYSHFQVGAAVLAESGRVYGGANVENASYGATTCAERNAIAAAVNAGERKLAAIAICGGKDGKATDWCPPCGICRQVMREFCDPRTFRVIVARSVDDYRVFALSELLPESFGPDHLI